MDEDKKKSVIGRAVVGGLLLGPLGALVGGMSGIGNKQAKVKMPDLILSITFLESDVEKMILFSCPRKQKDAVVGFFNEQHGDKFSVEMTSDSNQNKIESPTNVIAELEKLGSMKEKGFITEEEFSVMKKRIINEG